MKEIKFTADHVGLSVTHTEYGKGRVSSFQPGTDRKVQVSFNVGFRYFGSDGSSEHPGVRELFVGHNVKFEMVEEGELPEPKLICPVCGVHHVTTEIVEGQWAHAASGDFLKCPLRAATFRTERRAVDAMKNLIDFYELLTAPAAAYPPPL